jgi:hypothetical protein
MEQLEVTPEAHEPQMTIAPDVIEQEPQAPAKPTFVSVLCSLPLSEIYVAGNYRSHIDPVGLDELAVSVKHNGRAYRGQVPRPHCRIPPLRRPRTGRAAGNRVQRALRHDGRAGRGMAHH